MFDIFKDLIINIKNIKDTKSRLDKIKDNIKTHDNNFFDIKCNDELLQYINVFENQEIYDDLIINLEVLKNEIQTHIKNNCEHEWINDSIDIDPDRSRDICYCVKCDLTKK